jgi:DNA-binding NtrC family response regulator
MNQTGRSLRVPADLNQPLVWNIRDREMSLREPKVYVVDDEKMIADTLALILNQSGFAASAFDNPREALTAASFAPPPDLLISDIVMPEMSGIELAIQIRQVYPRCKVLLFSGQSATYDQLETARGRGYEFEVLMKPVHPADLLVKVRARTQDVSV